MSWVHRQLKSTRHERRVLLIATKLFNLTMRLHDLGHRELRLLRFAALVHDVGRRFGEKNHPADGARMIEEESSLPLTMSQRRIVCYLTRYHRGAVPKLGHDGILKKRDGRRTCRKLLALLRAADSLDSRQLSSPAISIALRGRELLITCFVEPGCAKSRRIFARRKKFNLLEDVLNCTVDVNARPVETVEHV